ncbi:MAG: HAD family hydrolase [Bacillota bacterium]|nr:HAD family hydrolase [Bacillota bacterium]
MSYDTILFDLDGTLTDSKEGITKSVQYALKKFDIHEDNLDNLEKFIGPPLKNSFMEYYSFAEEKAVQAVGFYREYFSVTGKFENSIYDGIKELLTKLSLANKKLIVATSKATVFSKEILAHFDIDKYFAHIVGCNLDGTRVEKGEIIKYIINDLMNGNSKRMVMIGDRKYDILGAKEQNIDSIAVTYGYGSMEELSSHTPTHIADSVDELYTILV